MYKIPVYSQWCLVMLQFSSRAQHIRLLVKWEEMRALSFLQDQASHIPWSCRSRLNKISLASVGVLQGRALQKGSTWSLCGGHANGIWHSKEKVSSWIQKIIIIYLHNLQCCLLATVLMPNHSLTIQSICRERQQSAVHITTSCMQLQARDLSLSLFHEFLLIPLPPAPSSHWALWSQSLTAFRPVHTSATGPWHCARCI